MEVDDYNGFVGSVDTRVLPALRKFEESCANAKETVITTPDGTLLFTATSAYVTGDRRQRGADPPARRGAPRHGAAVKDLQPIEGTPRRLANAPELKPSPRNAP